MNRLKKKDMVMVIAGRDKGKKGEVKEVMPKEGKIVVMGINIISKHKRPTKDKPGGIHKLEAPLNISNVQLICPKCNKPVRTKIITVQSGDKLRACRKCGEAII
jgi:large subunit ribosomal protein L24